MDKVLACVSILVVDLHAVVETGVVHLVLVPGVRGRSAFGLRQLGERERILE